MIRHRAAASAPTVSGAVALAVALALALAGCGGGASTNAEPDDYTSAAPDGLEVLAAFYPYWYVAQRVGGPGIRVDLLTEPGGEPHDLELSPRQVQRLSEVDLVIYQEGFQPAVDSAVAQQAADRRLEINAALGRPQVPAEPDPSTEHTDEGHRDENPDQEADHDQNTDPDQGHGQEQDHDQGQDHSQDEVGHDADGHGHDHGGDLSADPHVWMDPDKLAAVATATADALSRRDAPGESGYRQRAAELRADLQVLDSEFSSGLATCARRTVVVNHAAFGHLTTRYDLEQIAVNGLSPDAAPSPQHLAELATTIRRDGSTTVFTETLASPRLAETLAAEAGVQTARLDPLEGLARDDSRDFLQVMRDNLTALRTGLDCTSPVVSTPASTPTDSPTPSESPTPSQSPTASESPTSSESPTPAP